MESSALISSSHEVTAGCQNGFDQPPDGSAFINEGFSLLGLFGCGIVAELIGARLSSCFGREVKAHEAEEATPTLSKATCPYLQA